MNLTRGDFEREKYIANNMKQHRFDFIFSSAEKLALEKKIEDYRLSLKADFGYSDKDIKNDPDYQELLKELAKHK